MNLGMSQFIEDIEADESFLVDSYTEMKNNFWWSVGKFQLIGSPLSIKFIDWFVDMFNNIKKNPNNINNYFRVVTGGDKIGTLNGIDCRIDSSVTKKLIIGLVDEAKMLIGQNELVKKMQGKPYDKDLYNAFTTERSAGMDQLSKQFETYKGGVSKL